MIKGRTYVAHMAHECHRIEVAQRAEASAARAKAAREAREAEAAPQPDGPPNTPQPPLPDASPTPSSPLLDPSVTLASAMEAIENSGMDQPPDEGDWGPLHHGPGLQDLIDLWPDDIPPSLKTCPLVGDLSGLIADTMTGDMPFVERFISTIALTLEAMGTSRKICELALNAMTTVAELTLFKARRGCSCDRPDPDDILSESPPATIKTARKRLGVDLPTIAHPTCPNPACHEVLYEKVDMSTASSVLASLDKCPKCSLNWSLNDGGQTPLSFPRVPLMAEIERLVAYPGVEDLVLNWAERARTDAQISERLYPGEKIYRDQTDGTYLQSLRDPAGNTLDQRQNNGILDIFVNLSIDWLSIRASPFSPKYSVGPILLQLANVPQELRALQAMIMCVGLTPGTLV